MKIHEYNEMMAWLTRPEPRQMLQGGSRPGKSSKRLTTEKFIELYEKFLKSKAPNKTDAAFAEVLNKKGFKTQLNEPFTKDSVQIRRTRYGIEGVVTTGTDPIKQANVDKINNYLNELIPKLNSENKFYTSQEVKEMVLKKLKLPANTALDSRYYPQLKVGGDNNSLFSRTKKIDQALNKALASDKPLNTSLMKYLKKETGISDSKTFQQALNNSSTYQSIKNQGGDLLRYRFNNVSELFDLSLSDALTRAVDLEKGQPIFTGLGKEKYFSSSPKHKVMEFAKRSWNATQGDGPVKFFDSKGDEIIWKHGTKLPYRKVSFKYNGKLYNMSKLDDIEFFKKEFPEVYKRQIAVNRLRATEVDNPFKKGTKIPLLELLKLNSQKIYGWKSKRNTFDVLHGKSGVANKPFTDLSFNARDVNQMQLGLDISVKAGKIKQSDANKILKFLDEYTGSGNVEKLKQRQINLAKNYLAGKVKSYGEERNRILKEGINITAIKKYAASQGIDLDKVINTAKTVKGPKRLQALQILASLGGIGFVTALGFSPTEVQAAEPGQMPQGSPGQLSEDEEGLSLQDKAALGTVAVAGAKPAWKYLAKPALKIMGSPVAGLAFGGWSFVDKFNASKAETEEGKVYDALTEGIKLGEGENEKEILGSQVGMELLFPEVVKRGAKKLGVEFSKKGAQNALAALGRFAFNPIGRAASIMTPTGLTLNAAAVAKRYYDFAKDEMERLEQMKPEERKAYNEMLMDETYSADAEDYYTSEDVLAGKTVGYNQGGRVGFDEGSKPKSPGRRAFLKGITALAALPIVGRFFKLGKVLEKAQPYYGPTVEKIKGMPEWFPGLVKKLWNEGEDVTKKVAYGERQIVKRGTLEGGDDVDLIYQMDTGDVSISVTPKKGNYETSSGAYNKEYSLDYKVGQADEATRGKPADDFSVGEVKVSNVDPDGNVDWDADFVDVDEAMSDLTELENFAKKKK